MGTLVYGVQGYNGASLSDGLALANANCGSTQVNAYNGGSGKWIASTAFGGSWAIQFTNAASNVADARFPFDAGTYNPFVATNFIMPTLPADSSNPLGLHTYRDSSTERIRVNIDNAGKLYIQYKDSAGTWQSVGNPTKPDGTAMAAVVAGTQYRIESYVTGGSASSTTGTVAARIFAQGADINTYLGQINATNAYVSSNQYVASDVGLSFAMNTARTMTFSSLRLMSETSTWQGPYVVATPAFDFSINASPQSGPKPLTTTLTVARVAGTGTGTNSAFSVDWGDGTSSSPTSVSGTAAATFNHVYNPSTDTDFTVSVTGTLT